MAVIECSRCGGKLEINENMSVGTCMYCGSVITIPKSWEKKSNLYNRANYLRRANEFDKAEEVFEDILKEDNTEAEAHWGVLMCRYGIEYVVDPESNERIPTCHRTERDSIFSDPSYLAAMEYADDQTREVYEDQAQRIDRIQQKILRIVEQEEPYDVFICYKQTDDASGERTPDSYIGEDLYYELTRAGYKVFFAQQSLKPGTDYEPYIFAALFSARALVVIATKSEYANAVWVRNEWSRFLAMMKKDHDKMIIPVYKDMSPYDFPRELGRFHAMDTTRLGFLQDLRDGINKIVRKPQKLEAPAGGQTRSSVNVSGLLKRAYLFLEDGDFSSAKIYFDKVLDQTPEEAQAYWGQLLVDLQCRNNQEIAGRVVDLSRYNNYQKALRFGSEARVNEYTAVKTQCDENIRKDQEERERQSKLAKEKEQRRVRYHNDFERLKRKYAERNASKDAVFSTWRAQNEKVQIAKNALNNVKIGKKLSWTMILISVLGLMLPFLLFDYVIKHPTILQNHTFTVIVGIVVLIPIVLILGLLLYFILSIFISDLGCFSWILIIVGSLYGGAAIIELLSNSVHSLIPILLVKPYHLIPVAVGAVLVVYQIIRTVRGIGLNNHRAALEKELQEQQNILNNEWRNVQKRGYQELAALNEKNAEFGKELHKSNELFE